MPSFELENEQRDPERQLSCLDIGIFRLSSNCLHVSTGLINNCEEL